VEAGAPLRVQGIVVDWEGKILPNALKSIDLELQHLEEEYDWYWDEAEGTEHGHRLRHPSVEGKLTVKVEGGKFTATLTPSNGYGGYLVRAKMGATYTDLEFEGQSNYWWGPSEHRAELTPRPARPTFLNLQVPTQTKVGDSVSVSFKAPYRGSLLLTAETHVLVASEWRKLDAPGEVKWTFKVPEFVPNIYVSAFLIKDPHLESKASFIPDRAFGVASIVLEPTNFTQSLVLHAPAEVRSNSELSVKLDLGKLEGEAYATVAAVDEGILQLTRFQSPDPFSSLFSKRALGVETFETIGWTLLVPPSGNSRSTGGDGDGTGPNGRVQPVKPVALWSGMVRVPETGQATVKFSVPQYRGSLRVMAVVAGPKRLGRASKSVLVRDPLVVQSTLPRFLTDGDQIQIPVFVTNMSGQAQDVQVRLTAESLPVPGLEELEPAGPPVRFTGKQAASIKLEPGKAGTVAFQAVAMRSVGAAKFRVLVKGGDFESRDEADVPFVPAGPRSRETQRIALQVGKNDLANKIKGWVPTSERSTIWVTSNPYGESFEHLRWLVQYPYGCIEQTTSSTRPLLFVSELLGSVDPTLLATNKVEDMVMHGINRILSMQTPSGGFAYWPGSTETNGWGTAYATHLLVDAQKLGYPVPRDRLDEALTWLSNEVASYESGRVGQEFRHADAFRDTEAYAHFVLAMAGKAHKARILRLVEQMPPNPKGEQAEQMYGLKAALFLAGDRRYERDLKQPDTSVISDERKNSWSFYSDRRRRGFMLSVFQDLFGSDRAGEELASRVADSLSGHPSNWYTTQEVVWSVTGLGKRLQGSAKNFKTPSLFANGKSVSPRPQAGSKSADRTWALARAGEYKSLQVSLEDKGQGTVYAIVSSEGVKQHASFPTGGNGLKLTRRYRTLDGKEIDVSKDLLKLGDLIFVEVSLSNTSGDVINNIALVDRLPAGWEIENPRLGRGQQLNWLVADNQWKADYLNVRDDRVEYFGSLHRGETRSVVYAVRCVTAGKFTIPAVEAEAMYDPRIWARQLGGRTEVQGPWADYLL
jgi:uncharacterized repeat protein (TIGR01451 family)